MQDSYSSEIKDYFHSMNCFASSCCIDNCCLGSHTCVHKSTVEKEKYLQKAMFMVTEVVDSYLLIREDEHLLGRSTLCVIYLEFSHEVSKRLTRTKVQHKRSSKWTLEN
ncbi:hypothetical protein Q3G72_020020 [Acer saccharum]|nr:hypothetical protein Q3G72_020020 [Acer saccharum]